MRGYGSSLNSSRHSHRASPYGPTGEATSTFGQTAVPLGHILAAPHVASALGTRHGRGSSSWGPHVEDIATLWLGGVPEGITDADLSAAFAPYGNVLGVSVRKMRDACSGFVRFATRADAEGALKLLNSGGLQLCGANIQANFAKENMKVASGSTSGGRSRREDVSTQPTVSSSFGNSHSVASGINMASMEETVQTVQARALQLARGCVGNSTVEEVATLWLGGLPEGVTENDLFPVFAPYGQVLGVSVRKMWDSTSGFIRFARRRDGEQALRAITSGGARVLGVSLHANWAKEDMKLDAATSTGPSPGRSPSDHGRVGVAAIAAPVGSGSGFSLPLSMPGQPFPFAIGGHHVLHHTVHHPPQQQQHNTNTSGSHTPRSTSHKGCGAGQIGDDVTTIWLGGLPDGTTEQDLHAAFDVFGEVEGATVKKIVDSTSGFVRFRHRPQAELALQAVRLGSLSLNGTPVEANWAKGNMKVRPPPTPPGLQGFPEPVQMAQPPQWTGEELTTVWIGGLPEGTTEADLLTILSQFGQVVGLSVKRMYDALSGFVRYGSVGEAEVAVQAGRNGQVVVGGVAVELNWAKKNMKVAPPQHGEMLGVFAPSMQTQATHAHLGEAYTQVAHQHLGTIPYGMQHA
eukprot:TRINITY_DN63458_c0_g1_i1.p1 TRINITY_DN63458_c0_g1~~TRINITY_DN63458_c0_g1_i1.p1  ORF type:complete len:632 (+),score=105.21 TRINITY_DN63458_c0_g1_i1:151-2046(+)